MRYKLLGSSGLRVSELCLGTMTFGETWGWGASRDESKRLFDLFVEAGANFIDTSVNYTGKFLSKTTSPTRINPDKLELSEKTQAVVREVQKVAAEIGCSMSQVTFKRFQY